MPKTIAIVPVFNEERTLAEILGRISKQVDYLICVNDGSRDDSLKILTVFSQKRKHVFVVDLPFNTGMAGAIKNGFLFALYLESKKVIGGDDLLVTIDADGQHKPEYIKPLVRYLNKGKYDVVLTRRDFSVYPLYKIWGNRFLTWTNSFLSGYRYRDVESGLRALKVKTVGSILCFYTGMKYSCAQEIALISAREGYKINNDYMVDIAYYRPGTTVLDGFVVLFLSFVTYFRWLVHLSREPVTDMKLFDSAFAFSKKNWPATRKSRRK